MQKLIASILLLLYSTANFGLSLRLDYCGDAISDFALFSADAGVSECCAAMEPDEDCCNSEHVYLQEFSDKIQHAQGELTHNWDCRLNSSAPVYSPVVSAPQTTTLHVETKAPPLKQRSQVLLSCFLI